MIILLSGSFPAHADSLDEIANFTQKICAQSLSGTQSSTSVVAAANRDVNGLARALGLSVAAGGLFKLDGRHYEGIPQERLPREIPTEAQCRADLANALIAERGQLGLSASQKSELADHMNRNNRKISNLQGRLADDSGDFRVTQANIDKLLLDIGALDSGIEYLNQIKARGEDTPESLAQVQATIDGSMVTKEHLKSVLDDSRQLIDEIRADEKATSENIGKLQQENRQILEMLASP